MPPYWIIEHRSRGAFIGFDHDRQTGEWRPHFRWSVNRDDLSIQSFWSEEMAQKELVKISLTVKGCYLHKMPRR